MAIINQMERMFRDIINHAPITLFMITIVIEEILIHILAKKAIIVTNFKLNKGDNIPLFFLLGKKIFNNLIFMKIILLFLSIIFFYKSLSANELGSYNVELPKNLDQVDILIEKINTANPPLKTRGTGQNIFQNVAPATVIVAADEGTGSGFLIDKNGLIVTNYHVIERSDSSCDQRVKVVFCPIDLNNLKNAIVYEATVFKIDKTKDLALFTMNSPVDDSVSKVVPMVKDKSDIVVGMDVHAIGHPSGGNSCSYTKGYVSQKKDDHEWKYPESSNEHKADVIQTQTPINPGNSGGPLINDNGEVVGVNTYVLDADGINFAVSINEVIDLVNFGSVIEIQPETKCEKTLMREEDYNKNGVNDIFRYDRDCNGIVDLIEYDEDEDKKPDQLFVDSNENGKYEYRIYFEDEYALWYVDEDENEEFEKKCYDDDYDGSHDRCESLI